MTGTPVYDVIWHDEVASTNALAVQLAGEGERGPLWIAARSQTGGRGRRGRGWYSPPGNLYATLLISVGASASTAVQSGFVAALAIHDLASSCLDSTDRLRLKWPNDVLLDGAKLSGILAEAAVTSAGDQTTLALGCGVNLSHAPHDARYPAICLGDHCPAPEPEDALAVLSRAMQRWMTVWKAGEGFAAVKAAWCGRSVPLGSRLRVNTGRGVLEGDFAGLDASGALLLRLGDGAQVPVHAGDVLPSSHGPSSTGWQPAH